MEQQLTEIKQMLTEIKQMLQSMKETGVEKKDAAQLTGRLNNI